MLKTWFDVRSALCQEYGETLVHWSQHASSAPQGMTHAEWTATLRKHGDALLAFVAADNGGPIKPAVIEAAQDALRWTADNLLLLWD